MKHIIFTILFSLFSSGAYAVEFTNKILLDSANKQNANLPAQVDSLTWFMSVKVLNDRILQYTYKMESEKLIDIIAKQLNTSTESLKKQAIQKSGGTDGLLRDIINTTFKKLVTNSNCTTPSTRAMIDDGVKLLHMYYKLNEKYITQITVSRSDCN